MDRRKILRETWIRLPQEFKYMTQDEIDMVLQAYFEALRDMFEYNIIKANDVIKTGKNTPDVRLVVKYVGAKKYTKRTLKNVNTGEDIEIPEQKILAREILSIDGIERFA